MGHGRPFHSSWRRGWKDTKRGWKSWPFIAWEAALSPLAGTIVGLSIDPILGGVATLSMVISGFVGIWIGATVSAPLRQRNDGRQRIGQLEGQISELVESEGTEEQKKRLSQQIALKVIDGTRLLREFNAVMAFGDTWPIEDFKKWQGSTASLLTNSGGVISMLGGSVSRTSTWTHLHQTISRRQ